MITIVTHRKNPQNNIPPGEIRQTGFQFARLFIENPSAGWIVDQKSLRFLDVNATAILDYGYSREEFGCKSIFDTLPRRIYPL